MSGEKSNLLGKLIFLVFFLYASYNGATFPKYPTIQLIVVELSVLLFCEFGPTSTFLARKMCHTFSGLMMLHLDMSDWLARYFVYSVAVSSLMMVWQLGTNYNFRFSRTRDVGVSVYLCVVVAFFYTQSPLEIINPVFFADPIGALVGKTLTSSGVHNPKWVGEKTVGGSIAVFLASYLTIVFGSRYYKLFLSLLITLMEGLTLEFDNLFITATVITGYLYHVQG